jgi:hypothetical protein
MDPDLAPEGNLTTDPAPRSDYATLPAVLRIRDVYPGSRILIFTHPGSRIQKQQWKTLVKKIVIVIPFFGVISFTKLNYFTFEMLKKKIWANFQRIIELFTQVLSLSYQKYGFGIRDPEKTYSGSRIQGSKRHRIPDPGSVSATLTVCKTFIQNWSPTNCFYTIYR